MFPLWVVNLRAECHRWRIDGRPGGLALAMGGQPPNTIRVALQPGARGAGRERATRPVPLLTHRRSGRDGATPSSFWRSGPRWPIKISARPSTAAKIPGAGSDHLGGDSGTAYAGLR